MGDFLLEAATLARCVRNDLRPDLRAQLTAPGQLCAGFGITAPQSILFPWQRFGTLLQVVLALGNTLNALGSSHRQPSAARGFRLSSLSVLANTKSFDDSTCALMTCKLRFSVLLVQPYS